MYLYFDDSMKKTVPYLKSLEFYYIAQWAFIARNGMEIPPKLTVSFINFNNENL